MNKYRITSKFAAALETLEIEANTNVVGGSVDEYLEMTAIANPHVTLAYTDPEGVLHTYLRSTDQLPPEAKEIKPHPYGGKNWTSSTRSKMKENHHGPDFES